MTIRRPAGGFSSAVVVGGMALVLLASSARAEVRRAAVVIGNNVGSPNRPSLRYAEADASRLAHVILELGGFSRDDVYLLRGRDGGTLRAALGAVQQKVAEWRRTLPGTFVEILFYFSGHSDGFALELGGERFPFAEIKDWSLRTGAEVRLLILDSCKSGSLIAAKGGRPGRGFEIRMADALASTGEAVITSSAADELALESDELQASFFSHNLVAGLRGAADASGDGRVTLEEAYHYAFDRTLSETSQTIYGSQHPGYAFRLSGQGDLVLTELDATRATLELPAGFERVLVTGVGRDLVAEVHPGSGRRLGLPPGSYAVRAWRERRPYQGVFTVEPGQIRVVGGGELALLVSAPAAAKGSVTDAGPVAVAETAGADSPARPFTLSVAATALVGRTALGGAPAGGGRLELGPPGPSGFTGSVSVMATASGDTEVLAGAGHRWGLERPVRHRPMRFWGGVVVGGGLLQGGARTVTTAVAPGVGAELGLGERAALRVEAEWALQLAIHTSDASLVNAPRAGVGLRLGF